MLAQRARIHKLTQSSAPSLAPTSPLYRYIQAVGETLRDVSPERKTADGFPSDPSSVSQRNRSFRWLSGRHGRTRPIMALTFSLYLPTGPPSDAFLFESWTLLTLPRTERIRLGTSPGTALAIERSTRRWPRPSTWCPRGDSPSASGPPGGSGSARRSAMNSRGRPERLRQLREAAQVSPHCGPRTTNFDGEHDRLVDAINRSRGVLTDSPIGRWIVSRPSPCGRGALSWYRRRNPQLTRKYLARIKGGAH